MKNLRLIVTGLLTLLIATAPLQALAQDAALNAAIEAGAKALKVSVTSSQTVLNAIPSVPISAPKLEAKQSKISIFGYTLPWSWNDLALELATQVANKVVDSTVVWMQNGFEGNPAFVNNPGQYFGNIANGVVGTELNRIAGGNLCAPFQAQIVLALRQATIGPDYTPQCTLTGIGANLQDFYEGFSKGGGWDTWFKVTQSTTNNPYDVYFESQNSILAKANSAVNDALQTVSWGQGFKSLAPCLKKNVAPPENLRLSYENGDRQAAVTIKLNYPDWNPGLPDGACIKRGDVQTPGATIKTHLDAALPANNFIAQITTADQFDKLISALLNGLSKRFIFGEKGLLGKAPAGSSGGGGTTGGSDTPVAAVSCSAMQTAATANDTVVTWYAVDNSGGTSRTEFTWSGDEGLSGTTNSVSIMYKTGGLKSASITASSTRLDEMGDPIPGTHKETTVRCSNTVRVSLYKPLAVSCTPNNVTHVPPGTPVSWVATITGGSGQLQTIQWDGQQAHIPGSNNDGARMWPHDITDPNVPFVAWLYGRVAGGVITTDLKYKGQVKEGVTTQEFQKAGDLMTSIVTRVYVRDAKPIGDANASITVIDKDPTVSVATQQCNGTIHIDD